MINIWGKNNHNVICDYSFSISNPNRKEKKFILLIFSQKNLLINLQ